MHVRILAALLLTAGLASAQATVEGTVVNSVTRLGIEGVIVRFYTQQGVRQQTTTAGGGVFRFTDVKEGDYHWTFEKDGYETPEVEGHRRDVITRVAGKDTITINHEMVSWTTLNGRVIGPDGQPAANVPVEVQGPIARGMVGQKIVTDQDGRFRAGPLVPGTFRLLARPKVLADFEDLEGPKKDQSPRSDGDPRRETIATYYPSTIDVAQAESIVVRGVSEMSGYEIHMRSVPVYRLRGVVLDEAGKPAPKIGVELMRRDGRSSSGNMSLGNVQFYLPPLGGIEVDDVAVTGPDGSFEFASAPEGEWNVRADTPFEYDEATKRDIHRSGAAVALVSRRDADGVEIRLAPNFRFTADVEWVGENKPQGSAAWGSVMFRPVDRLESAMGTTKPDGRMEFSSVNPGRYYVVPMPTNSPGAYLSAVLLGGRDVLGQEIDLSDPPPPMKVVFKMGAGNIRGTIANSLAANVVVIPSFAPNVEFPRSVTVEAGRPFEFGSLRPGEYSLVAFDRIDGPRLADPAFLPNLLPFATRVHVEEGASGTVELRVNRWPD